MTPLGEALLQRLDKIIELLEKQQQHCDHVYEMDDLGPILYFVDNIPCYLCVKCGEYVKRILS